MISPTQPYIDEKALVARLQDKDRLALAYLYDHYSSALYGVIIRIVKNDAIADEILQDVFLKIWNRFNQYEPAKGKLFTWMVNICRNHAIDKMRSGEINKDRKTDDIENFVYSIDKKDFVEQKIDGIGVKELLNQLTQEQKLVVELLYFKGYSQSEVAEEFSIPLGTVKTRLRLALQQLRTSIK